MSNRTRYWNRKLECTYQSRDTMRADLPPVLLSCLRCDEYLHSIIAALIEFSKDEYQRGWREGVRALDGLNGEKP